ncbi:MAG: SDR family oxidoreductase [Thermoanaerobaculia bacterium]
MPTTNCLITGGTAGIGKAAALELARRGASVIIVGRDAGRGEAAVAELRDSSGNDSVELELADLSSQQSVRALADAVASRFRELHILINNAGVVEPHHRLTEDGIEATFAINHLAPYLLTRLLLPALEAAAPSRIVTVSSQVHAKTLELADLCRAQPYIGSKAYARSKLANILFTVELARRLKPADITANCLHPGVVKTRLLQRLDESLTLETPPPSGAPEPPPNVVYRSFKWVTDRIRWRLFPSGLSTPEEAAQRLVYLALSQGVEGQSGLYFVNNEPAPPAPIAGDRQVAAELWRESASLVGL